MQIVNSEMDNITDMEVHPCTDSKYVQPYRVGYKQNGKQAFWDCVKMHDSLAVLIYNKTRKAFVIVKQFRPAVYMSRNRPMWENSELFPNALSQKPTITDSDVPPSKKLKPDDKDSSMSDRGVQANEAESPVTWGPGQEGFTYELCAGLVDKDTSLEQIAKEEVLEETGYDVPLKSLEKVNSYCANIGTAGTRQQLFYCEVTDNMLVTSGGGNAQEGEFIRPIEVIYIPIEESVKVVFDDNLPKSSGLCFGFFWFDKYKRPQLDI